MDNELHRLATFQTWPLAFVSPTILARAGFFYTGTGDTVYCYKCRCAIDNWKENDIPLERHKICSENCPLVTSHSLPSHNTTPRTPIAQPTEDIPKLFDPAAVLPTVPSEYNYQTVKHCPPLSNQSPKTCQSQPKEQPMSTRPALETDAHLKHERFRLRTFSRWMNSYVRQEDLAKTGFYALDIGDCVRCVFCQGILKNWEPTDVPADEHKKHYPTCPFIRGLDVGNVPLPEAVVNLPHSFETAQNMNKNFSDIKARLSSFESKTLPNGQIHFALAEAGFYYIGPNDSVQCFDCGGILRKWMAGDDPWIEHAKWFPRCNFLIREKGHSYVQQTSNHQSEFDKKVLMDNTRPARDHTIISEEREDEEMTPLKEICPSACSESTHPSGASALPKETFPPASSSDIKSSKKVDETVENMETENEKLKDAILCKICMDAETNTVFMPCSHLLCCDKCAPAVFHCPICRVEIKGTLRVFLS